MNIAVDRNVSYYPVSASGSKYFSFLLSSLRFFQTERKSLNRKIYIFFSIMRETFFFSLPVSLSFQVRPFKCKKKISPLYSFCCVCVCMCVYMFASAFFFLVNTNAQKYIIIFFYFCIFILSVCIHGVVVIVGWYWCRRRKKMDCKHIIK